MAILSVVIIAACGCSSLSLLVGQRGRYFMAGGAFAAVGAYSVPIAIHLEVSIWVAVISSFVLAVGLCAALNFILGSLPSEGYALGTLCFQILFIVVLRNLDWLSNGVIGLGTPLRARGGILLLVSLCVLCVFLEINRRTFLGWIGTVLRVAQEGTRLPECEMVSVELDSQAHLIGGAVAGSGLWCCGFMLATHVSFVDPDQFSLSLSIDLLAGCLLGGRKSLFGSVIGGAAVFGLAEVIRLLDVPIGGAIRQALVGAALLGTILYRKEGVLPGFVRSQFHFGGGLHNDH